MKRSRKQHRIAAMKVRKSFSGILSLTDWVVDNITSFEKQEKYVLQGVRNNYEIVVDLIDTAEWVTRTPSAN